MANRTGRILVYILVFLALAVCLGLIVMAGLGEETNVWYMAIPGLLTSVTAFVIVAKRPANRFGTVLACLGLTIAFSAGIQTSIPLASSLDTRAWLVMASDAIFSVFFFLVFIAIPLLYPTGRTPAPRWRFVLTLGLTWAIAIFGLSFFLSEICVDFIPGTDVCADGARVSNPSGWGVIDRQAAGPLFVLGFLLALLAISSLVSRYRASDGVQRLQIKWLVFSVVLASSVFVFSITAVQETLGLSFPGPVLDAALGIAFATIPLACGVAILRHRLYDIDRLVSRTVTYTLVVGLLIGGVALVAALVGTRFDDPLVVAATTLAVAAVFNPLRRRVQAIVDSRFNRSRYDAERVMDGFALSLRDEIDVDGILDGWRGVVTDTMQPVSTGVWVRE